MPAIYKNSKYLERQFCCILSCEPHMFSSKCKIEQKHILHQFSNPSNVNLRVIIVPSVIVFTAHRKGPACSLNPHQSGECIGPMFAEQLDVVHGASLFNDGFQPDQRAEKSNKNQNFFNIYYENLYIVGHCTVKGIFGSDLSEGQQHHHYYRAIRVQ